MAEKMATRQAYGEKLKELGGKYDNLVVMDADLSGSTKTAEFKKVYPSVSLIWNRGAESVRSGHRPEHAI